jgi:hypothetical protein
VQNAVNVIVEWIKEKISAILTSALDEMKKGVEVLAKDFNDALSETYTEWVTSHKISESSGSKLVSGLWKLISVPLILGGVLIGLLIALSLFIGPLSFLLSIIMSFILLLILSAIISSASPPGETPSWVSSLTLQNIPEVLHQVIEEHGISVEPDIVDWSCAIFSFIFSILSELFLAASKDPTGITCAVVGFACSFAALLFMGLFPLIGKSALYESMFVSLYGCIFSIVGVVLGIKGLDTPAGQASFVTGIIGIGFTLAGLAYGSSHLRESRR